MVMWKQDSLIRFLALLIMVPVSPAFLFDNKCVAPSPCTCRSNYIYCHYKQLSQVPSFIEHSEHYSNFYIYLYDNQLTTIPQDAFKNLSSINATSITLQLYANHINQIDDHAFNGIAHDITSLFLQNNNLSSLPPAFKGLTALQTLNVQDNPLTSLDATVLSMLGKTLQSFSLSVDHMPAFPTSLHNLEHLTSLTIWKIQNPVLHTNVFDGFRSSLRTLDLSYSKLETIPAAVCHLPLLLTFTFGSSSSLLNSSLFDECQRRSSLTSLTLNSNHLTTFPLISKFAPHLQNLYLQNNNLKQIESSLVAPVSSLTSLTLSSNYLNRIPAAVNKFLNLRILDLNFNQITSIEDFDLLKLHQLTELHLQGNPLSFISQTSFIHSPLLNWIDLQNTQLHYIPLSLTRLAHFRTLYYNYNLQCTCDEMSYLKFWNVSAVYISGSCSSGVIIKTYLTSSLPKCP